MNHRRLAVRLALVFAVVQAIAVFGVLLALPAIRQSPAEPLLITGLIVVDLALLVIFSGWVVSASVSTGAQDLAEDVQRIADGDYHHRIPDPRRPELREIQESVNRLADRLIADQRLLRENVASLDETNRQLRRARDQVVHAARMASVGTLAAGIAHEVGNPLGAIMGFVDVARTRVRREGGDVELLDSIRSEAERIDRIVRGLLDYARPERGSDEPVPAEVVVGRVREILDSQGALDDVEVTWSVEGGERRPLGQPRRLEQVLVNLILNARDAVQDADGPRIDVVVREEAGELEEHPSRREGDPPGINYLHRRRWALDEVGAATVHAADRLTVIEVRDNGHGIPSEVRDRLFDPFFTTKEPGEGTGLGLSICARLVEGMGGRIDAEDRPDGGASFVIRLPVLYDTAEPEATDSHEQARL